MRSILIFGIVIFCSCSASRKVQNYYYIEPFKEQEILLLLKEDSTFNLKDKTGCNQFEFTGKYRQVIESAGSCFIVDSIKLQNVLSNFNSEVIFPLKNGDTAWIINKERLSINHQPFKITSKVNIDLQEIRYKKLKEFYINFLGKEGFLKVFGNGSKKEAKKRLLECKLPDINLR